MEVIQNGEQLSRNAGSMAETRGGSSEERQRSRPTQAEQQKSSRETQRAEAGRKPRKPRQKPGTIQNCRGSAGEENPGAEQDPESYIKSRGRERYC